MLALALTMLFTGAALASLIVLALSYARAFAVLGDLRAALQDDEDDCAVVRMRIVDHVLPAAAAPALRLVSSRKLPARLPQVHASHAAAA